MSRRRGVALSAAEEAIEAAPAQREPSVPVWRAIAAGWMFLFRSGHKILGRIWVAALILGIIEARLSVPNVPGAGWYMLGYVVVFVLASASLCSLALGTRERAVLAGFLIGPDELRHILTLVLFGAIATVLLVGANIIGRQVAGFINDTGSLASLAGNAGEDIAWYGDVESLSAIARTRTSWLAGLLILWLALRYAFVPLHVIAARKLAIFDALALTKRNTWRLLVLALLIWATTVIAYELILAGIRLVPNWGAFGAHTRLYTWLEGLVPAAHAATNVHGGILTPRAIPPPGWLQPLFVTLMNLVLLIVGAGSLAHAYLRRTGN